MNKKQAISNLDICIQDRKNPPAGIKVSAELYRALASENRIQWKEIGTFGGFFHLGIALPLLDEKIFVHVSPELNDEEFELPALP